MDKPLSVKELINCWKKRSDLSADLGLETTDRVHKWAKTNSIPAEYHFGIVQSAIGRGYPIDAELIAKLHCADLHAATAGSPKDQEAAA